MAMIITYEVGDSLYLNITNQCSNDCTFCVRKHPDGMKGLDLWLEREPTVTEVLADIQGREVGKYKELVFCGFGEPTSRWSDLLEVSGWVKKRYSIPIRINTNGQGSLIAGRDITPDLGAVIDAVSISLNAKNSLEYQAICQSVYGEAAFAAVLDFAARSRRHIPKVAFSVVDIMSADGIAACREIARKIGVHFRVRRFLA